MGSGGNGVKEVLGREEVLKNGRGIKRKEEQKENREGKRRA